MFLAFKLQKRNYEKEVYIKKWYLVFGIWYVTSNILLFLYTPTKSLTKTSIINCSCGTILKLGHLQYFSQENCDK